MGKTWKLKLIDYGLEKSEVNIKNTGPYSGWTSTSSAEDDARQTK
jgi:hypothetical protein